MRLLKNILNCNMILLFVEIMLGWIRKFIVLKNAFKMEMEEYL